MANTALCSFLLKYFKYDICNLYKLPILVSTMKQLHVYTVLHGLPIHSNIFSITFFRTFFFFPSSPLLSRFLVSICEFIPQSSYTFLLRIFLVIWKNRRTSQVTMYVTVIYKQAQNKPFFKKKLSLNHIT